MKEVPFFRRIFSSRILPSWTILLFDVLIVVLSIVLACLIRFSFTETSVMGVEMRRTLLLVIPFVLIFFRVFRTYSNILRLSSFVDIMHIFVALTLAYICAAVVSLLWPLVFTTSLAPWSVQMISYAIAFMLLATSRMVIKMLNDYFNQNQKTSMNTYIYGTQKLPGPRDRGVLVQ